MSLRPVSNNYAFLDAYQEQALAQDSEKNPYWFVYPLWRDNPALPSLMASNFRVRGGFTLPENGDYNAYADLLEEILRRKPLIVLKPKHIPPPQEYTPIFLQQYQFRGMPYSDVEQEPEGYFEHWHIYPERFSATQKQIFTDYDLRKRAWETVKEKPVFRETAPSRGNDFHGIHFNDAEYASMSAAYEQRKDAFWRNYHNRKAEFLQSPQLRAAMVNTLPAFQAYVYGNA